MSQKELGIKAGIDPSSASPRVNQYETGKHTPDFHTCKKLCEILKVPVAFLYADDEQLADFIKLFDSLSSQNRNHILMAMKK